MRRLAVPIVVALSVLAAASVHAEPPELDTDEKKTLYALGLAVARPMAQYGLSAEDLEYIQAGLVDGALGAAPRVDLAEYRAKFDTLLNQRKAVAAERRAAAGIAFLEEAAASPGAIRADSGMVYMEQEPGTGETPGPADRVTIHYHGTLPGGQVFDSSRERDTAATFSLNGVIACFRDGLQRMKVGGKSRLVCPPELAYGERGSPPNVPPRATLIFDVELLEIVSRGGAAGLDESRAGDEDASGEEPPDER